MTEFLLELLKKEVKKRGYISEEAVKKISKKTNIPVSGIYGVATFYSFLPTKQQGKNVIHVCTSPTCAIHNSLDLIKFLEKELKIKLGQTAKNKLFSLYETSCIGCCDEAPAMLLNGKPYIKLTKEKIKKILRKCKS